MTLRRDRALARPVRRRRRLSADPAARQPATKPAQRGARSSSRSFTNACNVRLMAWGALLRAALRDEPLSASIWIGLPRWMSCAVDEYCAAMRPRVSGRGNEGDGVERHALRARDGDGLAHGLFHHGPDQRIRRHRAVPRVAERRNGVERAIEGELGPQRGFDVGDVGQATPARSNIAATARRSPAGSPRVASPRGTPMTRSPRPVWRTARALPCGSRRRRPPRRRAAPHRGDPRRVVDAVLQAHDSRIGAQMRRKHARGGRGIRRLDGDEDDIGSARDTGVDGGAYACRPFTFVLQHAQSVAAMASTWPAARSG